MIEKGWFINKYKKGTNELEILYKFKKFYLTIKIIITLNYLASFFLKMVNIFINLKTRRKIYNGLKFVSRFCNYKNSKRSYQRKSLFSFFC